MTWSTTISLPWPPRALSPNGAHGHWAPRAKAKKRYRLACFLSAREQLRGVHGRPSKFDVHMIFVPPDRRRRDRDNLVARMKAGLDGLAEAMLVDDSAFVRVSAEIRDGVVPAGPCAEVRIELCEHVRVPVIERGPDGLPERIYL